MTPYMTTLTFSRDERVFLASVLTLVATMADLFGTDTRKVMALWERVQPDGPTPEHDKWLA